MIPRLLYTLGSLWRNPSLNSHRKFLKRSDFWSLDELKEFQFEKLRKLLLFANLHSPYYHDLFRYYRFNPDINNLEDYKSLPLLIKQDLINNNGIIHTIYPFKKYFISKTSGTSGQTLQFKRNEEWDSHNRAAMYRGFSWYDVNPWDRHGYFRGRDTRSMKSQFLDRLQNRVRLFSLKDEEVRKDIRNLRGVKFLQGYSSSIYEIAKAVNRMGLQADFKMKMIKGTSEKVFDSYQEEVKKAFGLKMINEYGAAETGLIAFECPEGSMHINMENVIVEVENGEIIVTNLISHSFPIIRYKLGDSVTLADDDFKCKCGRAHPVILDVLGRVGQLVKGKRNSYSSFNIYYVFKNLRLNYDIFLNYQAVQFKPGFLTLRIEQGHEPKYEALIKAELKKYFDDDLEYEIKFNEVLISEKGKLRDFVTSLN